MSLYNVPSAPQSAVGRSEDVSGRVSNNKSCWARAQDPAHSSGRGIYLQQVLVLAFVLGVIIQTGTTFHDVSIYRQGITRIQTLVISVIKDQTNAIKNKKPTLDLYFHSFMAGNISSQIPSESHIRKLWKTALTSFLEVDNTIMNEVKAGNKSMNESGMWRYLIIIRNVSESLAILLSIFINGLDYFMNGTLRSEDRITYIHAEAFMYSLLDEGILHLPDTESLRELQKTKSVGAHFREMIASCESRKSNPEQMRRDLEGYILWIDNFLESLLRVQTEIIHLTEKQLSSTLQGARKKEATGIGMLVIVVVISLIIIVLDLKTVAAIQAYAIDSMHKATELEDERKKSDHLLFQMLPPLVAQQLKQTQQVPAEYYEAVTIYFSDIVGFTEFAAENTPLKVVTFLNSIYELFDIRIECYDVYKIETIGDSYMIVSGLPVKNDEKHVSEIATMALDLLDISSSLEIPERSPEYLHIRSGIHTGPVMAGIVGRKMPRYCLFGDTVNTATLRIQISWDTKEALDAVGGFQMVDRGLVDVKGKGPMYTYWLEGRSGGIMRAEGLDVSTLFSNELPPFMQHLRKAESIV